MNTNLPQPKVLLIEDNVVDVDLTRECFEQAKIIVDLDVVNNGLEGLTYLGSHESPDIILLDLNMPKMDGREFLEEIKSDDRYKHIPVVVLTTSEAHEDIIKSYHLQASSYLSKPVKFNKFVEMMKSFDQFYLSFVKLPGGNRS